MKTTLPALTLIATLMAATAMAQASSEMMRTRQEILQTRYHAELTGAKTQAQKQAVITKYGELMNPARTGMNYSNLPPEQRATFGAKAVGAATYQPEGNSSWAQSRRKAAQERGDVEPTLDYYDLPGASPMEAIDSAPALLPPE